MEEDKLKKNYIFIMPVLGHFMIVAEMRRSAMIHSLAKHFIEKKKFYSKKQDYTYFLLKSSYLESIFGLRESIAGLINQVFKLEVDQKIGSTQKILKETVKRKLRISELLGQIVKKNGFLDTYLKEFRHPYVHSEDISRFNPEDLLAVFFGLEQNGIKYFIDRANGISEWMLKVEGDISKECNVNLGII